MELNNDILKYSLVLLTGLLIGWLIQASFDTPIEVQVSRGTVEQKEASRNTAIALEVPSHLEKTTQLKQSSFDADVQVEPTQNSGIGDWTGQELINYIASLDDQAFWEQLNSGDIRLALEKSPRLLEELMLSVLDLQDKKLNRSLLYLFENINGHYSADQTAVRFPIEKWIMQRVVSENRSTEWLSYMAKLGVQSKESYLLLAKRLDGYNDPEQSTAILSILARKPVMGGQYLTKDENAEISQIIEPFLTSRSEPERMFAVASLSSTSFEQSATKLLLAMSDESRRVRMSAMRVVRDNGFDSPEISAALMSSIVDTSLSAYERLGAYEVLSRVELSQEQYEAVYRFAENERAALEQEFLAERQAAESENR